MSDGAVIETFVSRPTWAPPAIESELAGFYQLLEEKGFKANTIGTSQLALRTLDLPTLVLLQGSVSSRGIFDRGAAYVSSTHSIRPTRPGWTASHPCWRRSGPSSTVRA
jgi:hypothetical protein